MTDAQGISLLCAKCGSAVGDDGRYWPGSGGLGCHFCKRRTPAQGIDSPKDRDDSGSTANPQEIVPEGMRPIYTIVPAHQGIINKYLILKSGLLIVGECWTESDAISLCKLMNEMAVKV